MEVGVFSKCIKELILDHDIVEVPGLGIFYAELMPASFSDHHATINPPYRKMLFRKCDVSQEAGAMLQSYICDEMHVTPEQAGVELEWCLSRIHSELDGNRICLLPGLGTMRSTSQSDYFFVSDDDLDIFPDGFGLEPVSIKAHEETAAGEKKARRKAARAARKAARKAERASARKGAAIAPVEAAAEVAPKRKLHWAIRLLLWLLAIAVIVVGAILLVFPDGFAGFGEFLDGVIDHILYSKEELQLLGR